MLWIRFGSKCRWSLCAVPRRVVNALLSLGCVDYQSGTKEPSPTLSGTVPYSVIWYFGQKPAGVFRVSCVWCRQILAEIVRSLHRVVRWALNGMVNDGESDGAVPARVRGVGVWHWRRDWKVCRLSTNCLLCIIINQSAPTCRSCEILRADISVLSQWWKDRLFTLMVFCLIRLSVLASL